MAAENEQKILPPLVSVIVPAYNYARFIGEAIGSLQAQTYQHWECIIVDDGSTDSTREVVAELAAADTRVKYFHQANQGQSAARNTGIRECVGDYIQFLDADDLVEPRKLERQVALLEARREVDIVYGGCRYFSITPADPLEATGAELSSLPGVSGQLEVLEALLRTNIMPINAALVRRRLITAVGFFDETLPQSRAEDWDYWLRCALAGAHFYHVNEPGTLASVRSHSGSSNSARAPMYRGMLLVRSKLNLMLGEPRLLALNREMAASDQGYLGIEEVIGGNLFRGVHSLVRAALLERKARWRAKWFFCALAAPFVPRGKFRALATTSLTRYGTKA